MAETQARKIISLTITPNSKYLIAGCEDKTVVAHDLQTNRLCHVLKGHDGWVNSVAVSPDSELVASCSTDATVRIWNLFDGAECKVIAMGSPVNSVTFSPDGTLLALGLNDASVVTLNTRSWKCCVALDGHGGSVNDVRFAPQGTLLASGSDDMTIKIWNLLTYQLQSTIRGHTRRVCAVSIAPDGELIASASEDQSVSLWDIRTGALKHRITGHTGGVNAVAFSPDGSLMVSYAISDELLLWDAATGESRGKLTGRCDDSRRSLPPIARKRRRSVQERTPFSEPGAAPGALVFRDHKTHSAGITRLVACSTSKIVASSSSHDNKIKLWKRGSWFGQLDGHVGGINDVAFSPSGALIASASCDGVAKVWHVDATRIFHDLVGHLAPIVRLAFSPDGETLITCSEDRTMIHWCARTGALLFRLVGHGDVVTHAMFSPDGQMLASCSADRTIRIWEVMSGTETCEPLIGHSDAVNGISWSHCGSMLASAADDTLIKLWDSRTPGVGTLVGHCGPVTSTAFSVDTRLLVSGSKDKTIRIWDLQSRTVQQIIEVGVCLRSVHLAADSSEIVTDRGTVELSFPFQRRTRRSNNRTTLFVGVESLRQNGSDLLWLDKDHHAVCAAVVDDLAVLGHASGAISFIDTGPLRDLERRDLTGNDSKRIKTRPTFAPHAILRSIGGLCFPALSGYARLLGLPNAPASVLGFFRNVTWLQRRLWSSPSSSRRSRPVADLGR
jgi:WD40 repeat protein